MFLKITDVKDGIGMKNVPEKFGSMVFNDEVMRERLPRDVYKSLHKTIEAGNDLDLTLANTVANAMKDWAIEKGATHYTHWFQPMTGITAEKHDSFISPTADGRVIMEFSGKELIKGEPDASSFPSGGLRATFEARGYTAWDPTSYAFIKDGSLFIPTVFCSFGGEALDMKTPLLRSMEAINEQAMRIIRLFGNTMCRRVNTTVGAEQEYFLIDKKYYEKRKDLIYTGRTLFGAPAPKAQELDDHYFGAIKARVSAFMADLDETLWSLGVLAKTKHNETAPAQHEIAPIFTTTNIAVDQNHLTMEYIKKIAAKHDLVALLHEKPFEGVNGSGKHNNWSISTDSGENLLSPGKTPGENAQFLLFIAAIIKAVDEYQDLLRLSVASAGNDHRLGAFEAPPAIISMFLGDELEAILDSIESGVSYIGGQKVQIELGVHVIPSFPKDNTDRNRTSPFAFTGNKFEFRMLGSSFNIAGANIVINTIVAEELMQFADILEKADNFQTALNDLIRKTIREHRHIIFNGNGYSDEWQKEAERRGLKNLRTTLDVIPVYSDKKNIELFTKHKIYTAEEIHSREEIMFDSYANVIKIEAKTMVDMVSRDYIPAVSEYLGRIAKSASYANEAFGIKSEAQAKTAHRIAELLDEAYDSLERLKSALNYKKTSAKNFAFHSRDKLLPIMSKLRSKIDALEELVGSDYWPVPTYGDLMFRI